MVYRVKEFAKLVEKSPSTLRRWEREGKIKPKRSQGNQRYYTEKDLRIALNIELVEPCRLDGLRSYKKQIKDIASITLEPKTTN